LNRTATWLRLIFACAALLAFQAAAKTNASDIESLIARDRWKEATRAIYLEARDSDPNVYKLSSAQARAGFMDDALDTIETMYRSGRSSELLSLARDIPSIPPENKKDLVQRSLDAARWTSGNYVKSGNLAELALFHSRQGLNLEAQSIFNEALFAANKGLEEEGNGGYQRITEAMKNAPPEAIKDWMFQEIRQHLDKAKDPLSRTFACVDLAATAARLGRRDLTSDFVECGVAESRKIDRPSPRESALQDLGLAAEKVGYWNRRLLLPPYALAIREAAGGNVQEAHSIVSRLRQNLYVDHGAEAYEKVFDDAIKRNDLRTAIYFAERPVRNIGANIAGAWQKIAEKQAEQGDNQMAAESYRKAAAALLEDRAEFHRYPFEVRRAIHLGESMRRNGMGDEGRRIILQVPPMIFKIRAQNIDGRIESITAASEAFWRLGMRVEAKKMLLEGYRSAHSYDVSRLGGKSQKARHLCAIGHTASIFSVKSNVHRKTHGVVSNVPESRRSPGSCV
jgi:hypothetical protein